MQFFAILHRKCVRQSFRFWVQSNERTDCEWSGKNQKFQVLSVSDSNFIAACVIYSLLSFWCYLNMVTDIWAAFFSAHGRKAHQMKRNHFWPFLACRMTLNSPNKNWFVLFFFLQRWNESKPSIRFKFKWSSFILFHTFFSVFEVLFCHNFALLCRVKCNLPCQRWCYWWNVTFKRQIEIGHEKQVYDNAKSASDCSHETCESKGHESWSQHAMWHK